MKYLPVILLFLLITCGLRAQTPQWSEPQRSAHKYIKIIGQDEENFFVLNSNMTQSDYRMGSAFRKREYSLTCYSDDMRMKWNKEILPFEKDDRTITVIFFQEKPVVLNARFLNNQGRMIVSARRIGKDGEYEGAASVIGEFVCERREDAEHVEIAFSQDQSKFLYVQKGLSASENLLLSGALVNSQLVAEAHRDVELVCPSPDFNLRSISISNSGNVYALCRYGGGKKGERRGFMVHTFDFAGALSSADLALEERIVTAAALSIDNRNRKIVVAGFYSDATNYSVAGTFYTSLDATSLSMLATKTEAFETGFLSRIIGMSQANKGKELTDYYIDRVILRNDGGAVILAESYYTTTSTYYDVFQQTYMTRMNYHYNGIIAISLHPDGRIHWPQVINKSQVTQEDGGFYSSYTHLAYGSKIYIVYNDFSGRSNRVMMVSLNNSGESSSEVLFKPGEDISLIPRAGRQIDQNVLVIPGERDDKFCYLKLSF
jgi:hypothetical protein